VAAVTVTAACEDGLARLRRAGSFDPLVTAWRGDCPGGPLSGAEADTLAVLRAVDETGGHLSVAAPTGRWRLPLLAAADLAAQTLFDPARRDAGPVIFVSGDTVRRRDLAALSAAGVDVAGALRPAVCRADGLLRRLGGSGAAPFDGQRLVIVPPRAAPATWVAPAAPRTVVVDAGIDPAWADGWAGTVGAGAVIVFTGPDTTADWTLDWPYLTAGGTAPAGAAAGVTGLVVTDERLAVLAEARGLLGAVADRHPDDWPRALRNASGLARALQAMSVPLDIYDRHTIGTIAEPVAARRADLDAARAGRDLPPPFDDVADIEWGRLRHCLLEAADALEDHNRKADALALTVEDRLAAGERVHLAADSRVSAAAIADWLFSGGWAIPADALADGRLTISALADQSPWSSAGAPALLGGLPPARLRHRLAGADLGPLSVLCYPNEARRLGVIADETVNGDTTGAATRRAATVTRLAGTATSATGATPLVVTISFADATPAAADREPGDPGDWFAAAEAAGLCGSEPVWLPGDDDTPTVGPTAAGGETVDVVAFLVEPGPAVVLIEPAAAVDRIAGGRVRPVPAATLAAGMTVVGLVAGEQRPLFGRLRPHLDGLRGPNTRLWLGLWQSTLHDALKVAGGVAGLAGALRARGGEVGPGAVAGWSDPYRIGPRRAANVARVGDIAGRAAVVTHAGTIGAVMAEVCVVHHRVGRHVAAAVRARLTGDATAFDRLEDLLGADVVDLLGDLTPWTVVDVLGAGIALRRSTRQPLTPAAARHLFTPTTTTTDRGAA
jgi:hypothetical protein